MTVELLVKNLRENAVKEECVNYGPMVEAADAIEALQARCAELEQMYVEAWKEHDSLAAELDALRKEPTNIPQGFALVPIRTTRAMEEVFDEEGWEWANLLAAAEAITLEEYEEATSEPVREPLSDEKIDAVTYRQFGTQLEAQHKVHRAFARAIEKEIRNART